MVVLLIAIAIAGYIWSMQTDEMVIMVTGFVLCALTYYYALVTCSAYLGEVFQTQLRLRGGGSRKRYGSCCGYREPFHHCWMLRCC